MCVHFGDKNADRDQNCFLYFIYFQRSGVYTHWFSHMCLTWLLAYMRNRRIFIGKSEALLSWLAICLLSSVWWLRKFLICENQTLKTKDIKKRAWNISQKYKWSWKMKVTNILLVEQHAFDAWLCRPSYTPPHKHTHTPTKRTLST